jgi:hypothetical protein
MAATFVMVLRPERCGVVPAAGCVFFENTVWLNKAGTFLILTDEEAVVLGRRRPSTKNIEHATQPDLSFACVYLCCAWLVAYMAFCGYSLGWLFLAYPKRRQTPLSMTRLFGKSFYRPFFGPRNDAVH